MKILSGIAAVAALFTTTAADFNVVGPFALRITGKTNSSIDGLLRPLSLSTPRLTLRANEQKHADFSNVSGYAWACHAAAATEGLCYAAGSSPVSGSPYEFYYNYTYYNDSVNPGSISYMFIYEGADGQPVEVPSFMRLFPNWASNVSKINAVVFFCSCFTLLWRAKPNIGASALFTKALLQSHSRVSKIRLLSSSLYRELTD
jgi:hypothetical protein